MRVGSLFSGIAGADKGLKDAGMSIAWQCEIEPAAQKVLAHHYPGIPCYEDVRDVEADAPTVDLVCGGFPCQDVSVAGRREGLGGERSGLWWEFHRVLAEVRPRWCLIENVPGLLSSNNGRDMGAILWALGELGYGWAYRVLDAQHFGVPQRRRRVFIVGCLGDGARAASVLLEPEGVRGDSASGGAERPSVARCLATGTNGSRYDGDTENFICITGDRTHALTSEGHDASEDGTGRGAPIIFDPTQVTSPENRSRPAPGRESHTLPAHGRAPAVAFHPTQDPISGTIAPSLGAKTGDMGVLTSGVRRLTPVECERLQGFPDGWTEPAGSDSARYQTLGNAVAVPVARWIGRRIMEAAR